MNNELVLPERVNEGSPALLQRRTFLRFSDVRRIEAEQANAVSIVPKVVDSISAFFLSNLAICVEPYQLSDVIFVRNV